MHVTNHELGRLLFNARLERDTLAAENRRLKAEAARYKWFRRAANWFIRAKNKQGDAK